MNLELRQKLLNLGMRTRSLRPRPDGIDLWEWTFAMSSALIFLGVLKSESIWRLLSLNLIAIPCLHWRLM
jgi:hypothetical protein